MRLSLCLPKAVRENETTTTRTGNRQCQHEREKERGTTANLQLLIDCALSINSVLVSTYVSLFGDNNQVIVFERHLGHRTAKCERFRKWGCRSRCCNCGGRGHWRGRNCGCGHLWIELKLDTLHSAGQSKRHGTYQFGIRICIRVRKFTLQSGNCFWRRR